MRTPEQIMKDINQMWSQQDSLRYVKEIQDEVWNEAVREAAIAVQAPYLASGMTNLAVRAKEQILKLIKE